MEVSAASDDFRGVFRDALHLVRPFARRFERGFDGLETRVRGQRLILSGEPAQAFEKQRQARVVVRSRSNGKRLSLARERRDEPRMAVAVAHRGIRGHQVEITPPMVVP